MDLWNDPCADLPLRKGGAQGSNRGQSLIESQLRLFVKVQQKLVACLCQGACSCSVLECHPLPHGSTAKAAAKPSRAPVSEPVQGGPARQSLGALHGRCYRWPGAQGRATARPWAHCCQPTASHCRPTSARSCSAWHRRRGRSRTGARGCSDRRSRRVWSLRTQGMYCKHSRGHSNLLSSVCLCTVCSKCSSTSSYAASRHCLVQKLNARLAPALPAQVNPDEELQQRRTRLQEKRAQRSAKRSEEPAASGHTQASADLVLCATCNLMCMRKTFICFQKQDVQEQSRVLYWLLCIRSLRLP